MNSMHPEGTAVRVIWHCNKCGRLLDAQGPAHAAKIITTEGECWPNCGHAKQEAKNTKWRIHRAALALITKFT